MDGLCDVRERHRRGSQHVGQAEKDRFRGVARCRELLADEHLSGLRVLEHEVGERATDIEPEPPGHGRRSNRLGKAAAVLDTREIRLPISAFTAALQVRVGMLPPSADR